jgi:hypothetical protein
MDVAPTPRLISPCVASGRRSFAPFDLARRRHIVGHLRESGPGNA